MKNAPKTRTSAQRYNARMEKIWNTYKGIEESRKDLLPTISDYSFFLDEVEKKMKISRDEARNKYGKYTYSQWKKLLKLA